MAILRGCVDIVLQTEVKSDVRVPRRSLVVTLSLGFYEGIEHPKQFPRREFWTIFKFTSSLEV